MFKLQRPGQTRAAGPTDVEAFIETARQTPAPRPSGRGRLVFALDATLSRQPTWDMAVDLQSRMFDVAQSLGGLEVQLVYYRGSSECRASSFIAGGAGLARSMRAITVRGGMTQLGRVLSHVRDEAGRERIGAMVFIGDALEEAVAPLLATAGQLALLGVKAFMFQEGGDRRVTQAFRKVAHLTGGAHAQFDRSAPDVLSALLSAAAAYAAGGQTALENLLAQHRRPETAGLLAQLR